MLKRINVLRTATVLGAALVVVLQTGCAGPAAKAEPAAEPVSAAEPAEIPITTASEEALAVFLEAREKFENVHFDEARELFSQAIEKDPDFARAYLYRGMTYFFTSTPELQEQVQRAAALADKVSAGEQLEIEAFQAYLVDQNPERAFELFQQLTEKYPRDKRNSANLGSFYYFSNKYDQAIAALDRALAMDKDYAPAYNMLGYAYRETGEYERAEEAFKRYIDLLPEEANPYDSMGDLLSKMGRHQEAVENYLKAADLNPNFLGSRRKAGINLCWLGRYDEGREAIRKAMELAATPASKAIGANVLARSYLYEGEYPQALGAFDHAMQIADEAGLPGRAAWYHIAKGDVCYMMGDLDKADQCMADCRKALQSAETAAYDRAYYGKWAQFRESLLAARRGDFDAALAKADDLKAQIGPGEDPTWMANYHGLVGLIYLDMKSYQEAVGALRKSNLNDMYLLYHLAVAESQVGNKDKAPELFEKVAYWNEDSHPYAFVRAKALAALKE